MNIRNVTESKGSAGGDSSLADSSSFIESLITNHSVPFVILFCLFVIALLPCCLINCNRKKKRNRLSIIADSENTEELASLKFEEAEKVRREVLKSSSPPLPAPLTRRNLTAFTRLESIDEERSRESSIKSCSTVEELAETVEGLRNSITEEWGGQLNEKVSKQIKHLLDKIRSLKMRSHRSCEECDSGMALLTPRSHRLSSQVSVDSARRSTEVERILENIRSNAEELKSKVEKRLQIEYVDENVVSMVKEEVSKVVGDMLEMIPPTPIAKISGFPQLSPWIQKDYLPPFFGHNQDLNFTLSGDKSPVRKFNSSHGEREEPWCPKSKPSREPSPEAEEEKEGGIEGNVETDTLPSSWRPVPVKKLKKIKSEKETMEKPMIVWTPEVQEKDIQFPTNLKPKAVEEDKPMMEWTPEPRDKELKFPKINKKSKDGKRYKKESTPMEREIFEKEEHGLWELEMEMEDVKRDIERTISLHNNEDTHTGDQLRQLGIGGLMAEIYLKSSKLREPEQKTAGTDHTHNLDFHNY